VLQLVVLPLPPVVLLPPADHQLGGTGRTQLAVEYAYRYADTYDLVWWIPAEQTAGMRASLVGLAQRLGLSRSSLREAVKALCLIRVLDVRQGDGTYVTSLEPHLLLDALGFVVDFHSDDAVMHFFEVRRILEPAATALAAERMPVVEIEKLQATLDEPGPEPSIETLVANDLEFHRRIAAGHLVLGVLRVDDELVARLVRAAGTDLK